MVPETGIDSRLRDAGSARDRAPPCAAAHRPARADPACGAAEAGARDGAPAGPPLPAGVRSGGHAGAHRRIHVRRRPGPRAGAGEHAGRALRADQGRQLRRRDGSRRLRRADRHHRPATIRRRRPFDAAGGRHPGPRLHPGGAARPPVRVGRAQRAGVRAARQTARRSGAEHPRAARQGGPRSGRVRDPGRAGSPATAWTRPARCGTCRASSPWTRTPDLSRPD